MKCLVAVVAAMLVAVSPLASAGPPDVRTPEPIRIDGKPAVSSCTVIRETFVYRKGDKKLGPMLDTLGALRKPNPDGTTGLPGFREVSPLDAGTLGALRVTVDEGDCPPRRSEAKDEALWGPPITTKWCEEVGCIDPNPPDEWYHYMPGSKVKVEACQESIDFVTYLIVEVWVKQGDGSWKLKSRSVEVLTTSCELTPM